MRRARWPLLLAMVLASAVLGYLLRDVIYQLVIVPLAYAGWLLYFYYSAIPQWIIWTLLLAALLIAVLWSLVPDAPVRGRRQAPRPEPEGEVEKLVAWMIKSREGNYFKWQLANRMGRVVRQLNELSGGRVPSADEAVEQYLDAGLNYSFVDFPTPRNLFARRVKTPLDLEPKRAVDYLESLMEKSSDRSI
ncbi:MAG: hypothetical protein ACM3QS_00615 [Bacteroidota bacterium]